MRSWVAGNSWEVSGVGGMRVTAGIDVGAIGESGGGTEDGGGGGDRAGNDCFSVVIASGGDGQAVGSGGVGVGMVPVGWMPVMLNQPVPQVPVRVGTQVRGEGLEVMGGGLVPLVQG